MSNEYHDEYDPLEFAEQLGHAPQPGSGDPKRNEEDSKGLSRQELLVKGGLGAAAVMGLGAGLGAAAGPAAAEISSTGQFTGTLRFIGLGVDLTPVIQAKAEEALGFKVAFTVDPSSFHMVQVGITQPDSYDIFSGYHYQYDRLWPAGVLQKIDTRKIPRWKQVTNLPRYGKQKPGNPNCTYGQGDPPFRSMYIDSSGKYPVSPNKPRGVKDIVTWVDERTGRPYKGLPEPRYINAAPNNFNMDSMGYNRDVIQLPPEKVSWAQLLNGKWKGRVALLNDPGIILQDLAHAVEALGLMKFKNKGDMTKAELDRLTKIGITYKKKGQFRAFWTSFNDSVTFMSSGEVVIESMWSPAVALLADQGFPIGYAAPPEGYRGWSGGLAIAKHLTGAKLEAAYKFINWWYSGVPGAVMMRHGYYNGVQATSRQFVDPVEWDFWIAGKAASKDITAEGPFGPTRSTIKGTSRDGGSLAKRGCKYNSWNSYYQETAYQIKKTNEFLSA